jgi:hypothetical protein
MERTGENLYGPGIDTPVELSLIKGRGEEGFLTGIYPPSRIEDALIIGRHLRIRTEGTA